MHKKLFAVGFFGLCIYLNTHVGVSPVQAQEFTIGQKNKVFILDGQVIDTLTVKQGDTINFMNDDPWFHNIYSLSATKTFDLGSYPQGESRSVTFDKKGVMEIECAIHPEMHLKVSVK
jgi:plastocyanin